MKTKYFFRLGHCPDLSVAEFGAITSTEVSEYNKQYLISEENINVNIAGSLVFGGEVVSELSDKAGEPEIINALSKYLESAELKKIGLYFPNINYQNLYSTSKKFCKKVVFGDKLPNFGHWKLTNNWVILIHFKTSFLICRINSYSDQEFWSKLDMSLPHLDMSRGLINLKLGRTLCNLTKNKKIWDNFGGQGRVLASAMDIKESMLVSDIDIEVMKGLTKNIKHIQTYWERVKFDKNQITSLSSIEEPIIHDATKLLENEYSTIVTEGYLGKNFKANPSLIDARKESNEIEKIWKELLDNYSNSQVKEIIACVPYYPKVGFVPMYNSILEHPKWQIAMLTNKHSEILYQREKSNVGHLIFRLTRD